MVYTDCFIVVVAVVVDIVAIINVIVVVQSNINAFIFTFFKPAVTVTLLYACV